MLKVKTTSALNTIGVMNKMGTTTHFCINIDGVLKLSDKELKNQLGDYVKFGGQTLTSGRDIRKAFEYQRALGRRVLPLSEACDNFDYQKGCLGHETKSENN